MYLTIIFQISSNKSENEAIKYSEKDKNVMENDLDLLDNDDDDDDDGENVISLNKIKEFVNLEDDKKSHSDAGSEKHLYNKAFMSNIKLQSSFQPGSTPSHLLSYFMVQYNNNAFYVYSFNNFH